MKDEHAAKRMLRSVWMVAMLIVLLTIQTATPHLFELFSVVPNFVLLYCICCSIKRGSTFALVFSTFGGLLLDVLNGGAMGANGVLFLIVGFGCKNLHRLLYHRTLKMVLIYMFAATLFFGLASWSFYFLLYQQVVPFGKYVLKTLYQALYHVLLTPIFYLLAGKWAEYGNEERTVW